MGLAIINQQANYTLERKAQNVIPVDERKRVYLTEVTNFTYEYAGDGIYRLKSLNIGNATQPYNYSLVLAVNQSGAEIDPISGVVTVSSNFTGGNIKVQLSAIYSEYYPLSSGATAFTATTNITDVQVPSAEPATTNNHLTITSFTYSGNAISASGGNSGAPTLNYSYTKMVNGQETTVSNTDGTVEYTMHAVSDFGATVNSTSGVVTVPSNSVQFVKSYIVQAKVTVDGTYQTEVAKVTQAAAVTPTEVTYTYAFSNVSLSYSGTPVAATGNSTGLTPTLTYTLTKTGSDNSSESISASSISYAVQGTKPTGVTLTASNGKVTFAANGTDDPVSVTIKATLTAPDGTTATPTATLTQNARTLTGISFKSYQDQTTAPITVAKGTTINTSDLTFNLIYDAGSNGTLNGSDEGVTLGTAHTTSQTFSTTGTVLMVAHYGSFDTNISVTVVSVNKAYITGFPESPYLTDTNSVDITNDGLQITVPLRVKVMTLTEGEQEMTFKYYRDTLTDDKETYDNPIVTLANDYYHKATAYTINSYGDVVVDLTKADYVYDITAISSIQINHSTNGTSKTYASEITLKLSASYNAYFTQNFNSTLVSEVASGTSSFHYSETSSNKGDYVGKIKLSSDGKAYKLPSGTDYYISIDGHDYVGIISTDSTSLSTSTGYTVNGTSVKMLESSGSRTVYVHHTTNLANTFIVGLSSSSTPNSTWRILTPKTNS